MNIKSDISYATIPVNIAYVGTELVIMIFEIYLINFTGHLAYRI